MTRRLNALALRIARKLVLWATQGDSHAGVTKRLGRETAEEIRRLHEIIAPIKHTGTASTWRMRAEQHLDLAIQDSAKRLRGINTQQGGP